MRVRTLTSILFLLIIVCFCSHAMADTKEITLRQKISLPLSSQSDYKLNFSTAIVPDHTKLYSFPGSSNEPIPILKPFHKLSGKKLKKRAFLTRLASSFLRTRYRWGGTGPGGFDCTGFVYYLYKRIGMPIPRTIGSMFQRGTPVSKKQLNTGDILFFINTYRRGLSHVGIYLGKNKFIHASGRRRGVRIDSINSSYFIKRFFGARRIIR